MKLYLSVISFFVAAFIVFNHFVYAPIMDLPLWLNIVGVISSTVAVIAVDGIAASVCHALQKKHFHPDGKYFIVSVAERRRLEKLGIKRLKKLVPDLGGIVKFPKGKILEPGSKEYVYLYLKESCSGEAGHIAGMILGFLIMLIFPRFWFCIGLPVAIVNLVLSFLPVLVLRYNRHSLNNIYNRLVKRDEIKNKKSEDKNE